MASRRAVCAALPVLRAGAQRTARPFFLSSAAKVPCLAIRPVVPHRLISSTSRLCKDVPSEPIEGNTAENEAGKEKPETKESRVWSFDEVKKQVESNASEQGQGKVVIVDVREPAELQETGRIPGAINIPITSAVQSFHISGEDFEEMYGFERPSTSTPLLFYCKAGVRARGAAALAQHAGWSEVGEYTGSWLEWAERGGPVEKN
ncbi:Rhodanese-like domain-containing protein [Stachybotrys elegans]|uniref:Rhodanese-like domain-containing protein n=1 Tax=Stachybotrys elegans TaxID=80388 RepID=A0A8K0WXJ7_9HYPO|nr:Rhodanese-like domain-containing protein [Stachybotrys elegans]